MAIKNITDVITENHYASLEDGKRTQIEKMKELRKNLKDFKGILDSGWDRSDIDRAILVLSREIKKLEWRE